MNEIGERVICFKKEHELFGEEHDTWSDDESLRYNITYPPT